MSKNIIVRLVFIAGILSIIASAAILILDQFFYLSANIGNLVFTIPSYGYLVFSVFSIQILLFVAGIILIAAAVLFGFKVNLKNLLVNLAKPKEKK